MAKVTFNTDLCKGCGLCVDACPKKILAISKTIINKNGHFPAEMTDQEKCCLLYTSPSPRDFL